ncbi:MULTISPECIES: MFS transporter [Pseudomonas syringae group]|uniref:Permease of the major facilitator superfamily n=1 Tax=Pseudomonas syringae pv. tagetis TaxID=129140 RepID=A0A0Q0CFX4_9PSED|nr:Permease of the major facilitator superfamily [Pseudomonas syringae pv. tagetis]RMR03708.1 Permease of the major facilitator superfamily [Pseudomonas syringae pv. helianthi]RMW11008.1 Permease of the major facilitator superfamily [Pseudomonas syringae pv. tagetis]RMW26655.1 Permease of the major facilitator superfamily [Pseudomonas syringae pv. tagetis]
MTSIWRTSGWVLLGSALILALSLGIRHGFGLFLAPMSADFGWGREVFAFAIALQNLMWGLAQPFAGALADRFGAAKVVFVGGVLYAAGLLCMSMADSSLSLSLSAGLLIGIGLSGTSFSVILGVVGRALPAEKRSMGMGIASAAGSFGQFAMLPGTLGLISWLGWSGALLVLGVMVALILPLVGMLKDTPSGSTGVELTLGEALREACSHSGFWLLALGFFVCGFQVVFIGVHLPAYLVDQHLPAKVGTTVLALIGLFNIFGTYTAGWLGGRMSKPRLLTTLYLLRAVVIVLFLWIPLSQTTAYLFGVAMGLLWLSTVPLTNGTVATLFGVRNLSMLGGIVFLFHQLGAFLGGWLGGLVYDRTGSYDLIWQVSVLLSLLAAALNWPVRERPVARLQAQGSLA